MRLRIGRERLARLLGPTEVATEREILPERIALGVRLPHEDASEIRVPDEVTPNMS